MREWFAVIVAGLLFVCGLFALIGGILWLTGTPLTPPCDGSKTGVQHYHGHVIECFYGDVVKVYR